MEITEYLQQVAIDYERGLISKAMYDYVLSNLENGQTQESQ